MSVNTLEFNELSHSVVFKGSVISLNPLSFKLLKALADSNGDILSVNVISAKVWGDRSASAETIKQRVFVLRKAITESGVNGLTVQSVRGEGYRLIIDGAHEKVTSTSEPRALETNKYAFIAIKKHKKIALPIGLLFLAIIGYFFVVKTSPNATYVNDRIALWTNIKPHQLTGTALNLYTNWNDKLLNEMKKNNINLIFSEKQQGVLVPVQARRNRLALISYFEVLEKNEKHFVNLSIVEPRTATVLRSDSVELAPTFDSESLLKSHMNGITKLLSSNKLNLTKNQKENPKHRIWPYLKALANDQ